MNTIILKKISAYNVRILHITEKLQYCSAHEQQFHHQNNVAAARDYRIIAQQYRQALVIVQHSKRELLKSLERRI